jgi:hypothetical protein
VSRLTRSSLIVMVAALVLGGSVVPASAAVLFGDGFGGTVLRPRWNQVDARWSIKDGELRVRKLSVNHRTHVGFAVVDLGRAYRAGLRVSTQVRLSPGHSNVGLVVPFRDARNYLYCKIEVTPGNPDGAALIGRRRRGGAPSVLRSARGIGLDPGGEYHLTLERRGRTVRCGVRFNGTLVTGLRYRMTDKDLLAFGGGSMAGMRIKVDDRGTGNDEDDGRSRFLSFRAIAL